MTDDHAKREPRPLTPNEERQLAGRQRRREAAIAADPRPEPIPGTGTRHSRWDVSNESTAPGLDGWVRIVDTAHKIAPLHVRVGEDESGRLIIVGLHIDGDLELTARAMREISLPEIVKTIAWRQTGSPPPPSVGDVSPIGLARFEGVAMEIERAAASASPAETKRGRPGPTDDQLQRVVDSYRRHARQTRNAIAATMREVNLSRASVQRHLDLAHARGLFPEGRHGAQHTRKEDR
ncbi:hypothetical protein OR221_0367 [Microbacterium laevaniformans OR221]|jgi:hypothetical protein|nr:hypothetical protein OR221_0367 [Microbacterium laevaniformans OR221]